MKKLKGNQGFSLVELIIVIAIMAALVAILAPQFLKYVEKSRIAADETTADQILNAVKVECADPSVVITTDFTVVWDTGAKTVTSSSSELTTAILGTVIDTTDVVEKSALYSGQDYTVTVDYTAGTTSADMSIDVSGAWAAHVASGG